MKTVDIDGEAALSALVGEALTGGGKPVARVAPIEKNFIRRPGTMKGMIKMSDDFDAPLPDDL